jgi:hypothetical protein
MITIFWIITQIDVEDMCGCCVSEVPIAFIITVAGSRFVGGIAHASFHIQSVS